MKATIVGLFSAIVLVASAAAHAFLGWPQFKAFFESAGLNAGIIAALSIGWYFGSVSMLAFGVIVLQQAIRRLRGQPIQPGPLWTISAVYLLFGTAAYVARDFKPHFLIFVGTGVLVGLFAFLASRHEKSPAAGPVPH